MQVITSLLAASLFSAASAHTVFTTLFVDGVSQGNGTCVRLNQNPNNASFPVEDLSSNDMACGFTGEVGVSRVCGVDKGARLTFQWEEWANGEEPGVIADGHMGPCAVYMKRVDSAIQDPGYGDGWFKLWDAGYDNSTGEWCTTKLINAGGYLSVDLPHDLAGGYYLVRPELLALHQANAQPPDPQFYIGCAQIFLNSDETAVPANTVSIPGYVGLDASTTFDIYTPVWPYPMIGPAPYEGGAEAAGNIPEINSRSTLVQTEGLKPDGCILENGNWCGFEMEHYTTMDGCWNASNVCWDQDGWCWNATITGNSNCDIWESHCKAIQNACNSADYNGPPNAGQNLQLPYQTLDAHQIAAATEIGPLVAESPAPSGESVPPTTHTTTAPAITHKTSTPMSTVSPTVAPSAPTSKKSHPHSTPSPSALSTPTTMATRTRSAPPSAAPTDDDGEIIVTATVIETDVVVVVVTKTVPANAKRTALPRERRAPGVLYKYEYVTVA